MQNVIILKMCIVLILMDDRSHLDIFGHWSDFTRTSFLTFYKDDIYISITSLNFLLFVASNYISSFIDSVPDHDGGRRK